MKVLIWGYGLEGKSTANYFKQEKPEYEIYVATAEPFKTEESDLNFILEKDIEKYDFDLAVKSSGVSFYKQEVQNLLKKGTKITSNLNIFLEQNKAKTIAITGTKGKSTTSSMLYYMLKNMDYNVALVGNIGKSFLDLIGENFDYVIMELSSYQVKSLQNSVNYGIILNLYPEHIDWHLTHENYFKDKLSLAKYSKKFIYNATDDNIKKYLPIKDNFISFCNEENFHIKDGFIYNNKDKITSIESFDNIKGEHIFKNLCALLTFLQNEKIDLSKALAVLHSFKTLEHRLEIFYRKDNTIFVDDSISTIPEATIEALKTFKDKELFLILGGYDRKQDYTNLVKIIKNSKNIKKIFLLGETGKRLLNLLDGNWFDSLENLVLSLKKENLKNKTVLLSPASPSYDMFKNFEERGNLFKKLMLND